MYTRMQVENKFGSFVVNLGDVISCFPYTEESNIVVGINQNIDPNVIVVMNGDNNYDTRLISLICKVVPPN